VEAVLTKAEKNKLLRQAEYVSLLETSFLGRFIDLRIDKNLVDKKYLIVVPGLGQDRRCNFDKNCRKVVPGHEEI